MPTRFLLSCPHFASLPEPVQAALNKQAVHFEYAAKHTILHPDEPWQSLYWITKGVIRMYYLDTDGREHNKAFFSDNDFFWPVTESLRAEKTGFIIETVNVTCGWKWSFEPFRQAFPDDETWLKFVQPWQEALLSAKLRRERDLLQLSATERYQVLCKDFPELVKTMTDAQLASYIGITPESLSRIKRALRAE
ncbi:Crp/Fnr family transcriptional regulator [Parasalinivibrio latis]|uniref:Crp/Fnr family transcriptional regulator n=1 Tax=Parasalinivibrio latis TaxID=2952610 RepID=UPI0030E46975